MNGFRQYRPLSEGEFFVIFADTASGGRDNSVCQFFSTVNLDFPLVYQRNSLATEMTNAIHPVIEKIHDITGVSPVVAYERNNGGVFELERLASLNRANKYRIYTMKTYGSIVNPNETKIGFDTNTATRPKMLGEWKEAVDKHLVRIYDKPTLSEHYSFIINKQGKPEAERGAHDDCVIASAGCWQLYQTEKPLDRNYQVRPYDKQKWSIS